MKRLSISALAVCLVLCFALPAMAVDVDFSGSFRTDGIYHNNTALNEGTTVSDAYYQGRFRLKSVFSVNDNVSITTRFDALEKVWGKSDEPKISSHKQSTSGTIASGGTFASIKAIADREIKPTATSDDNIDFDWAYATLKTPVGGFLFGRMSGGAWGLRFGDDEGPRDRIVYVLPIDKFIFAAVAEKYKEIDADNSVWSNDVSDADQDKYYLTATYKAENYTTGLLYGFYNYQTFQDMYQKSQTALLQAGAAANYVGVTEYIASGAATAAGVNTAMIANNSTASGQAHVLSPYFKGKFGPVDIKAELTWATAEGEFDSPYYTSTGINAAGSKTKDLSLLEYMGELNYEIGPFTVGGGYAYQSGDANFDDNKVESFGFLSEGADWDKTLILFSDEAGVDQTLGGIGNPIGEDTLASWFGYKVFFLQADYDLNENINLGAVYANSKADEVPTAWDDAHGSEIDLIATFKFLNNVTWYNYAAFLSAGDFYKAGNAAAKIDDTYTLFSRIVIDF